MSTVHGGQGNIVTNGLVLNLNAGNPRSYPPPYNGTTWTDLSGNGRNGTLTNGPTFNSSNGGIIVFDGTDDRIPLNSATTFGSPSNLTINVWVKYTNFLNTNLGRALFRASSLSENVGFSLYQATGAPYNRVKGYVNVAAGLNVLDTNTLLNTNQWYFITMTYNSSQLIIYINGAFETSSVSSGGIVWPSPAKTPQFGESFGSYFAGSVGLAQVYNRALSASEVLQNFNATRARFGI